MTVGKSARPLCSVCIANFNGASMLPDCIESVLAQEGSFDIEIIVHDDASTDSSLSLLKEQYPYVTVIESRDNVGFCRSNNRMAERARGEYILLLNNDAALYPDALATLLAASKERANPGITGLPQYDWDTGKLVDRGCLLDPFYYPIPNLDSQRRDVAYVVGACLWLPRGLWNDLGGFPEWMESVAEDLYLGCRARIAGASVEVAERSGYRHRQGASLGGSKASGNRLRTTYRRRFLSERNKTAAMIVCTPTPVAWLLALFLLNALAVEGISLALLRGNIKILTSVYLAAIKETLRQLPRLAKSRKEVQGKRAIGAREYFRAFQPRLQKLYLLLLHGVPHVG